MNIKKVIKEHGYTIEGVAEKMGISRVTLSQNISRNPTVMTLERIADAIGCKVGDFFADDKSSLTPTITCPHCGKEIRINVE